jgi:hypothetical protein
MTKLVLIAVTALFVAVVATPVASIATSTEASATPGAVNKQGCHGKPKHCHSADEINTTDNGRRYVPFGRG